MYSTRQLTKLLENTKELFLSKKDWFGREMFFAASENQKLEIQVQPTKSFYSENRVEIFWNPIVIAKYPDPERLEELQRIEDEIPEHELEDFQQEKLRACIPPKPKDWKKTIEMEEGRYLVPRYREMTYRGVDRMVLFLQPSGDDGTPTQDFAYPVWGYFLQQEADRINLEQLDGFLYCQLGKEKTTAQKKKDRLVALFAVPTCTHLQRASARARALALHPPAAFQTKENISTTTNCNKRSVGPVHPFQGFSAGTLARMAGPRLSPASFCKVFQSKHQFLSCFTNSRQKSSYLYRGWLPSRTSI